MSEAARDLEGRVVLVTGASRGIGRAIAEALAARGARLVLAAKSDRPHPQLEGTLGATAAAVVKAGGEALPLRVDVRDAERIESMFAEIGAKWGRLDALVHNAGAIHLAKLEDTPLRKFDLVHQVNARAAFALAQGALKFFRTSPDPPPRRQMIFLAPPVDLSSGWLEGRVAYSMSKYGISLLVRGLAEELRPELVSVQSLWPRKIVATAAVRMLGGEEWLKRSRRPAVMADAVCELLVSNDPMSWSGRWLLDDDVLREQGRGDLESYAVDAGNEPLDDLYVGDPPSAR